MRVVEAPKVRLSLDLSPEANTVLDNLASQQSTTKADILRKAIALIDVAITAKQQGQHLAVLDGDKTIVSEIIGV